MEIVILFSLFVVNGLLSMSEIAVVSARKARLQQLANEGNHRAAAALALAREPSNFLSTIQVGITFVGIFSGAFGEATLSLELTQALATIPALAPYSEALALTIVVVAIAYFSLIIGELVPKRLALQNPELIASLTAAPMRGLSRVAHPVVLLLSASTDLLLRMLGAGKARQSPVSEDEIRVLMEQGTRAGIFERYEQRLVHNVLLLDERSIAAEMTPRLEVVFVDLNNPLESNLRKISESRHSRFPVCRGDPEHIVGVIHAKDILASHVAGARVDLAACMQDPLFVPETLTCIRMLEIFKGSPLQIALVVDEYGDFQGLVTLNDILEAIVGDMPSSHEEGEQMIIERSPGSWLIDGMLGTLDLKELLDVRELPGEDDGTYHTLGGMTMIQTGRVPQPADAFEWGGYRFEVVDMDGTRVDKVLVTRLQQPNQEQPEAGES
ncbi:MAG: HlyC/CorC family transporter [Betaproteobacteria bacterium]|nr:MAG: HlyC/CorC family transporter [Betaproteobacteria bacterium]